MYTLLRCKNTVYKTSKPLSEFDLTVLEVLVNLRDEYIKKGKYDGRFEFTPEICFGKFGRTIVNEVIKSIDRLRDTVIAEIGIAQVSTDYMLSAKKTVFDPESSDPIIVYTVMDIPER